MLQAILVPLQWPKETYFAVGVWVWNIPGTDAVGTFQFIIDPIEPRLVIPSQEKRWSSHNCCYWWSPRQLLAPLHAAFPPCRTCLLLWAVQAMGGAFLLEQPRSSMVLWHPRMRELMKSIPKVSSSGAKICHIMGRFAFLFGWSFDDFYEADCNLH